MKLVLDLDDVLCNFVEMWNVWLHERGYTSTFLRNQDITTYDYYCRYFNREVFDFYQKENCYDGYVEPLDGSHLFLEWCEQEFDEVMILSYSSTEHNRKCKKAFVKKHFNFDNIKFSDSKNEKFTFTKGSILMDDYPVNLLQHTINNKNHSILFNKNGNNGWGNYYLHNELVNEMNSDQTYLCHTAESYDEAKDILTFIKESQ